MHSITPHIDFKHIKGKENVLVDSLSRLKHLGLHEENDPEESGYEYGKSIFDTDKNTVFDIDSEQNVRNKLEIDSIKYCLNGKGIANLKSQVTDAHTIDTDSLLHMCNLDPEKIKQLQQQDGHMAKIIDK